MKEGLLIGGGLIVAGLLLELSVEPVVWDAFRWPVNCVVLAGLLVMIAAMWLLHGRVYAFRFLMTYQAAIPAMGYAVVLTIIMGLTRQTQDGRWLNNMLTFWPFVLEYVYMAVILGLVVLKRTAMLRQNCNTRWEDTVRQVAFLLNHLGLFIAMVTATLGNADMQRLKMVCLEGQPEWRALTQQEVMELPLAIELRKFIMETYDDGSPKRYASEVNILTKSGKNIETTIDVNKPAEVEGWKIYQYGYDTQAGPRSQMSILELVSDPWLPVVYTGIFMMLGGAACMFVFGRRRKV